MKAKHPKKIFFVFFEKKVSGNKFDNVYELAKYSFHVLLTSETRVNSIFLTFQLKISPAKSFTKLE